MKAPSFTHEELMQLWHAVSQYIENRDEQDEPGQDGPLEIATAASDKLDAYVQQLNEATP